MKQFATLMTLVLVVVLASTSAFAQLSGKVFVPKDYPTLDAAIADLNAKGVAEGGVMIIVEAENPVTVPAAGFAITARATETSPIYIEGSGNDLRDASNRLADVTVEQVFKTAENPHLMVTGFGTLKSGAVRAVPAEQAILPNPVQPNR